MVRDMARTARMVTNDCAQCKFSTEFDAAEAGYDFPGDAELRRRAVAGASPRRACGLSDDQR